MLGSVAFTPVKSDMTGNIKVRQASESHALNGNGREIDGLMQKLRDRQLAAPADSEDIQSLVMNEIKAKKHTAAEGLTWLIRYGCIYPSIAHLPEHHLLGLPSFYR